MSNGRVYIVGAGCGDFDLITMRGAEYIRHCDVLVYDSLIDVSLLGFAPETAEKSALESVRADTAKSRKILTKSLLKRRERAKRLSVLKAAIRSCSAEAERKLKPSKCRYSV